MASSAPIVNILELAACISSGLAALRLGWTALYKRYRVLFAYVILSFFHLAVILFWFTDSHSKGYLKEWLVTEPIWWFLSILMVLELYSLILEKFKGLATLGRWFQYAGLTLSIGLSALTLLPQIHGAGPQQSVILSSYFAIERGLDSSLLIFLLLMLGWLARYPVPLSRNVIVHSVVYSVLFLSNALGLLLRAFFGIELYSELNTGLVGLYTACILAWFLGLSAKGEEIRMSIPRFSAEQEERILHHLEALNSTLLKVSRN